MKKHLLTVVLGLLTSALSAQNFNPASFLGYEIGERFTRQDKVVAYFQALQAAFPSTMKLEKYGESYEHRDLLLAFLGTAENLKKLEEIRQNHQNHAASESLAIVWLSYNVHGNESSGTEAAMQTAYRLLTDKSDYLKNTVVIMDPCLNPDGRDRYVNFYQQYGNTPADLHKFSAEHKEPWPSGRPNHYLFDLNRDWAWMTQIESEQRVKRYNQWLPHVHVDFHEQGINEPYYFPRDHFHPAHRSFQYYRYTLDRCLHNLDTINQRFLLKNITILLYQNRKHDFPQSLFENLVANS